LTVGPRLDAAIKDWHAMQPPAVAEPVIQHHPVDTEAQTGDSRLLGGPISIHSPWERD